MKMPPPITVGEVLSIIERLHPDSLLLVRDNTGLDEEDLQKLWLKVVYAYDPRRRLATIEYLLLIMHEARAKDPSATCTRSSFPGWASSSGSMTR